MRTENLCFKEEGVHDVLKDMLLPWYNTYCFFIQNVLKLQKEEEMDFLYSENTVKESANITCWRVLSLMQLLFGLFETKMAAYGLYIAVLCLVKFMNVLTSWYVRMNHKRLKGKTGEEDCAMPLEMLFSILISLYTLMAPIPLFLLK